MTNNNKKAQEEMVGFAFIIIIVAIILLVFVSLAMNKPQEEPESYEVESFIQALLQSTTDCEDRFEFLSVQKLVSRCNTNSPCIDGRNTCDVLNDTLSDTFSSIWQIKDRPVKGYNFLINSGNQTMFKISEGNQSNTYKGTVQLLPNEIGISFKVYY